MIWLIGILVLALIVGPIMYVKPSAKEKRLARLRERARKAGLQVKLAHIDKLNPEAEERVSAGGVARTPQMSVTGYGRFHGLGDRFAGDVMLQRVPNDVSVPVVAALQGWHAADMAPWHAPLLRDPRFLRAFEKLPEWFLAVAIDRRALTCYWTESEPNAEEDRVAVIADHLSELLNIYEHFLSSDEA